MSPPIRLGILKKKKKKDHVSSRPHLSHQSTKSPPSVDCLLHLTGSSLRVHVMSPPSLLESPWSVRHCLFALTGSSLNKEVMLPYSRIISPRAETISPPSDQSLPQMGAGWFPFPLSLPGTCHRVADSLGGPWGRCTHSLHIPAHFDTPHLGLHGQDLGQHLRSSGTPPCLLPRPAAPGGVGQEVHLPLGMPFLLWVKEYPPFG